MSSASMVRAILPGEAVASSCSSSLRSFTRDSSRCSFSYVRSGRSRNSPSPCLGKAWRAAWYGSGI
eukprot:7072980-Pyramimonas_sp.AAC.1